MTSELRPTGYISEFVSGGHKNYAYRTVENVTFVRTHSESQGHYSKLQRQTFGEFRSHQRHLSRDGEPKVTVHTERKIMRKRKGGGNLSIMTEPEDNL